MIKSPNHPNNYPRSLDCSYLVQIPSGNIVTLSFTHFDLESKLLSYIAISSNFSSTSSSFVTNLNFHSHLNKPFTRGNPSRISFTLCKCLNCCSVCLRRLVQLSLKNLFCPSALSSLSKNKCFNMSTFEHCLTKSNCNR